MNFIVYFLPNCSGFSVLIKKNGTLLWFDFNVSTMFPSMERRLIQYYEYPRKYYLGIKLRWVPRSRCEAFLQTRERPALPGQAHSKSKVRILKQKKASQTYAFLLKISKAELEGLKILSAYVFSTSLNAQFSKSQGIPWKITHIYQRTPNNISPIKQ